MSIHRISGSVCFECDDCGEELETNSSDFNEAFRELRDAGWKARKVKEQWEHVCDACIEDEAPSADDFEDVSE